LISRGRRGTNSHLLSVCEDAVLARGREAQLNCKNVTRCLCLNGINIGLLATRKSRRTAVAFVMHTYIHTYIHTVLPSRSFTTSFVFPSFSDPATTFETHSWKKLTCGVIRSFNCLMGIPWVYVGDRLICTGGKSFKLKDLRPLPQITVEATMICGGAALYPRYLHRTDQRETWEKEEFPRNDSWPKCRRDRSGCSCAS